MAAYLEAAERAEAVFANREAIDHLEAALALDPSGARRGARADRRAAGAPRRVPGGDRGARDGRRACRARRPPGDRGRPWPVSIDAAATWPPAKSHLASALGSHRRAARTPCARGRRSSEASSRCGRATSDAADAAARDARLAADRAADRHLAGVAERLVGLVAQARGDVRGRSGRVGAEPRARRRRPGPDRVHRGVDGAGPGPGGGRVGGRGDRDGDGGRRDLPPDRRPASRGGRREPPRRHLPRRRPRPTSRWRTSSGPSRCSPRSARVQRSATRASGRSPPGRRGCPASGAWRVIGVGGLPENPRHRAMHPAILARTTEGGSRRWTGSGPRSGPPGTAGASSSRPD